MSARTIERLAVHRSHERAGILERTTLGARFTYDAPYAAAHSGDGARAIAFSLPVRAEPYEVAGVNLHPFFAGLLPEGLRLRALVRGLKTSEDDLFTLLAAVGEDTIGDVAVTEVDAVPTERSLEVDPRTLASARFREMFHAAIDIAKRGAHTSVAGVQPKVSAVMVSLPLRSRATGGSYLLKLTPDELPRLAENELFFMTLAREVGLDVARVELVHDAGGASGLLVERFDRVRRASGAVERLHQEDACQILGRYPADKYRLKLADVALALDVCSAPLVEKLELLRLQAFSYLIANGDLHAKNVSVLTRGGAVTLAPAYDLLSTLPYGDRQLALSMEGRDERLAARHFLTFGERIGLRPSATRRMLIRLLERLQPRLESVRDIGLDPKATRHLERVMRQRLDALQPDPT